LVPGAYQRGRKGRCGLNACTSCCLLGHWLERAIELCNFAKK
jgi:hypothetical protein